MIAFASLPEPKLAWGAGQARVAPRPMGPLPVAPRDVLEALGPAADHDGRKWHVLGALGGVLRRAGYSKAACEALVRAWLPVADSRVDVGLGLTRALGAWRLAPESCTGDAALAECLSQEHAELVCGAIVRARWPRAAPRAPFAPSAPHDSDNDYDWDAPEVPLDWYCKGLAIATSERKVTLIAGDPGAGKGPLANYLAVCFAWGLSAWGVFPCKRCNVGVLDFEGARLTARRIRSHVRGLGLDVGAIGGRIFLRDCDPGLDAEWIHSWCAQRDIEVLIVDSYMSATSADAIDPNSPEFAAFARELGALGIVVIVIAHARKRPNGVGAVRPALGDLAGSFALAGMAATAIAVWNPEAEDTALMRVACMRGPDGAFPAFDVRWASVGTDDEPSWRAELVGAATRAADDASKEADAARERDAVLSDVAARVIATMRLHPDTPQAQRPIADASVDRKLRDDVPTVLGAMARAGFARSDVIGGVTKYTLVLDEEGVAPRVRIVNGEAVADDAPRVSAGLAAFNATIASRRAPRAR